MLKAWRVIVVVVLAAGCQQDKPVPAADKPGSGTGSATVAATATDDAAATATATATATASAADASTAEAVVPTGPPPAFVGRWKLDAVRTKDGPVAKEKLEQGAMTWAFNADGTMDMRVSAGDQAVDAKGTWTLAGDTITIDESGQINKVTFKRTGDKLVLAATASSVVMTFKLMMRDK